MKPLIVKRVYNEHKKLIYELNASNEETIIRYDYMGNKVYEKHWKKDSGEIYWEEFLEYDRYNNLIHFKDTSNRNEYWIEYNDHNRPIKQTWNFGKSIIFEYDEKGNVSRTFNEKGELEIEFINKYLKV